MWGSFSFPKKSPFTRVALIFVCLALFLLIGFKLIPTQNQGKAEEEACHTSDVLSTKELEKPLKTLQSNDTSNQSIKAKTPAGINKVRLAEMTGELQKVIIESNTWQLSPDVIIAKKGLRTDWTFKLINNDECNGKILIEKFGMKIPITGKEVSITFAPWKDFFITCEQGKFNYYVKVVEKLGAEETIASKGIKSEKKAVSQTISPKAEPKKVSTPVPAIKPEEKQIDADATATLAPESGTNKENKVEDNNSPAKEEPQKEPEKKKGGFLDSLFNHHH